jgi:hypothetical protein
MAAPRSEKRRCVDRFKLYFVKSASEEYEFILFKVEPEFQLVEQPAPLLYDFLQLLTLKDHA